MKNMINKTHIEGYLYEHKLEQKVTGPNSKNPGTPYIAGTVSIATDEECTNIVQVHYSYTTATTSSNKPNATYVILENIVNGGLATVMGAGKDAAAKLRIDSAIGLNDFYTDRNGVEELVSAKRNEGGFMHLVDVLDPEEKNRNTFECDIVITNVRRIEADEDKNLPEKAIIKGAIFDFRKALLPVEFTAINPHAIDYFEGLEASQKEPVFTKIWGRQIAQTIVREFVEESAFGDARVRKVPNTHKDFIITGANPNPYEWDVEGSLTVTELNEAITARETYLATVKQRNDAYKASKGAAPAVAAPAQAQFNF